MVKSSTFGAVGMLVVLLALLGVAYGKNPRLICEGAREGGKAFVQVLPAMLLAFMAAALVSKLVPQDVLIRWLGDRSGVRGLAIATVAGSLTPGGPFVQFPIVAALYDRGVAIGPLTSYLSAWALLGLHRLLIFEVPLLGWKLSVCRFAVSLACPMTVGYVAQWVWGRVFH